MSKTHVIHSCYVCLLSHSFVECWGFPLPLMQPLANHGCPIISEPSIRRSKLLMGSAIIEPCYVCIVRSEYVRPGCCGSVSIRALYPGVRRCEDSTLLWLTNWLWLFRWPRSQDCDTAIVRQLVFVVLATTVVKARARAKAVVVGRTSRYNSDGQMQLHNHRGDRHGCCSSHR